MSFFGHVHAEASVTFPCTQEERSHEDAQHDAPEALQPPSAHEDTLDTRTDHPVTKEHAKILKYGFIIFAQLK